MGLTRNMQGVDSGDKMWRLGGQNVWDRGSQVGKT